MQKIITSHYFHSHDTGEGHPECPKRYEQINTFLENENVKKRFEILDAQKGTEEQILLVHDSDYLSLVKEKIPQKGFANLDEDTVIGPKSWDAIMHGVGGVCQAVDLVMSQQQPQHVFVTARPPGHHAFTNKSMGFCVFSNIAIASAYAVKKYNLRKAVIIDIDVHHGNGTQDCVSKKLPDVALASLQEEKIWPYNDADQITNEQILNIGLETNCPAEKWIEKFQSKVIPFIRKHEPELILVSAGFDAHKYDPPEDILFNDAPGRQNLLDEDYKKIAQMINSLSHEHSNGRVVSVLEGGYNVENLPKALNAYLSGFET